MATPSAKVARVLVDVSDYDVVPADRGDELPLDPPVTPGYSWVGRVVDLPGKRVQVRDGAVVIDGAPPCNPVIPDDRVFVCGDCHHDSVDSRSFGPVPPGSVGGRVWYAHRDPSPGALRRGG